MGSKLYGNIKHELNFVAAVAMEKVALHFHFKGKLTQTEIDKLFTVHPQAYHMQPMKLMHLFRLQLAQNISKIWWVGLVKGQIPTWLLNYSTSPPGQ